MTHSIYPCLWFEKNAQAALEWYCSIFPHSHMIEANEYVAKADFAGVPFLGINGAPNFHPNPSISFMVICENQTEIDHLWNQLIEGGSTLMALEQCAWSDCYGWLQDRYGFSWQLYLGKLSDVNQQKIVPTLMYCGAYQGQCQAALNFYQSLFKRFRTQGILKYSEGEYTGQVKHSQVIVNHFTLMAMDSGSPQPFEFNEAISLIIECED